MSGKLLSLGTILVRSRRIIRDSNMNQFEQYLIRRGSGINTLKKYVGDVKRFRRWAGDSAVTQELLNEYRAALKQNDYNVSSINSYLGSINVFLQSSGWSDLKAEPYKNQRQRIVPEDRKMSVAEYKKLLDAAAAEGNIQLYLTLQVLATTGLRVSELHFVTAESVLTGEIEVYNKGKFRKVHMIPAVQEQLKSFAKERDITEGMIFRNRKGGAVNRSTIWRQMRKLAEKTGVDLQKVFPHNLRKLFATTLYEQTKDIERVAEILGHSSINTTRCYIYTDWGVVTKQMERLGLADEGWKKYIAA